jgi:membrane protease subunit HflC
MKKASAIIILLVILGILAIFSMTFTVAYNEVAIQSRFGKVDEGSIVRESGLHFRLPFFADSVYHYDTRLQIQESALGDLQTADSFNIAVQGFLLWRVQRTGDGPLAFYQSFADFSAARDAVSNQFRDALSSLSQFEFDELLGKDSRLVDAEKAVRDRMVSISSEGIEVVAVGLSRIAFLEATSSQVVSRMQARRDTLADSERARGTAEAERIRSSASGVAEKILAFASQRAQEIRTDGEELAARYLAKMGEDEELAVFLLWLDALEKSLSQNTTYVIDTAVEPWHLLESEGTEGVLGSPGTPKK